jgi:EmrB/QacA subfamily drug resistance transporter
MTDRVSLRPRAAFEPAPAAFITGKSYYPWVVVGTTCIGSFIGQLDASIVQLALPTLEHEFTATLSSVSWVAIAYQVAFASALPVFARLAEIAGRKLMYLAGYALFAIASLLCGLASDLTELVLFRVLLGIGGAMLGANSVVILLKAAGPERRGRAMGIVAAAQAVGVSLGPIAGGVLLAALDWHWVFWASVPFALVASIISWLVVPKTTDFSADRRFDWRGAVVLMPALTSLLLLISEASAWGAASPLTIGALVVAICLMSAFVVQELRTPAPLIDLELFRIGAFAFGIVAVVLSYAMLYGMFFLMSFALVRGYHDSPLAAGLRLAIIPVALGIVAPFSGALHERLGVRGVLFGGMAICIAALVLLRTALAEAGSDFLLVMFALIVFGVGLGVFIAPNNSSVMAAAPGEHSGEAGGLLNLMRVFGTSIGVACASAALSWRLAVLTGSGNSTLAVSADAVRGAVTDCVVVLIVFGSIAAVASVLRGPPVRGSAVKAA